MKQYKIIAHTTIVQISSFLVSNLMLGRKCDVCTTLHLLMHHNYTPSIGPQSQTQDKEPQINTLQGPSETCNPLTFVYTGRKGCSSTPWVKCTRDFTHLHKLIVEFNIFFSGLGSRYWLLNYLHETRHGSFISQPDGF